MLQVEKCFEIEKPILLHLGHFNIEKAFLHHHHHHHHHHHLHHHLNLTIVARIRSRGSGDEGNVSDLQVLWMICRRIAVIWLKY
jgi:hypothetical protein